MYTMNLTLMPKEKMRFNNYIQLMELEVEYSRPMYQSKNGLGSNSTIDAQNSLQEQSVVIWVSSWVQSVKTDEVSCIYCPKCLKKVKDGEQMVQTRNWRGRRYLGHSQCCIEDIYMTEFTRKALKTEGLMDNAGEAPRVGCREFLISISFNHPLNSRKFFDASSKHLLNAYNKLVYTQNKDEDLIMDVGSILIPIKQISVSLQIQELSSSTPFNKTLNFQIDLTHESDGSRFVKFIDDSVVFQAEIEVFCNIDKKIEQIKQANYKIPFSIQETDFLKMKKFIISLPFEQNLHQNLRFPETSFTSQNSPSPIHYSETESFTITTMLPKHLEVENSQNDDQEFIAWIKTHGGSKQFQRKSSSMTFEQIQFTTNRILPYTAEIIQNDYANYMLQSLLAVSNINQRISVIESVRYSFCDLACEQQGTFVFQQMIDYLSTQQEFQLIFEIVCPDYERLFMDNYGNHFMRKFIQCMPCNFLYMFIQAVIDNLIKFSINRNSVCVLKSILRALKEGEIVMYQLFHETDKILNEITMNTGNLINDEFGNYIIQQAFELFPLERLSGINEYILQNFSKCACLKYSSNVLQNCVKKYWRNNEVILKDLRNCLQNKSIIYMYNNKDGNKVLLEIMCLRFDCSIKDKIYSLVIYEQASRFNNKKWMEVTGKGKTGSVGTSYNSFSEAHQPSKKKSHYKN